MPYRTWTNYGYGICTDKINVNSVEKIEALLECAPKYRSEVHDYFNEFKIVEPTVEDYLEFDDEFCLGLASILKEVINEAEGIEFLACDNYNCERYLIYPPIYPWQMTEKNVSITEEKLERIFLKYVCILTNEPIDIKYRSVENGC